MDNSKGLKIYNEWFISALKSSKVDGQIEEKKLLQNCLNCHNQVKSASNSENDSYLNFEEFRLDSTILLLLGCPCVNELPAVLSCNELLPLIKSVPSLDVENFFVVLKGLKNNKYLRGILPWLPTEVLVELLTRFITLYKTVTPLSLAISYEIFYSLIYSLQYDNQMKENVNKCINYFADYLKSSEISSNTVKTKFTGYYFMYTIECINLLTKYLDDKSIVEPYTFSFGLKFKTLQTDLTKTNELEYESTAKACINVLSSLLNAIVLNISTDIWISWHDIKAPSFGLVGRPLTKSDAEKAIEKSIQTHISHTVYTILKTVDKIESHADILNTEDDKELDILNTEDNKELDILNAEDNKELDILNTEDNKELDILNTEDNKELDILNTEDNKELDILNKEDNKELAAFFKVIATDPDYDSDNDLSTLELIDAIKKAEDARHKKLLSILLDRDDIFEEEECSKFLKEISSAPKSSSFIFIKKLISLLKNDFKCAEDWKFIALELSNNISNEDVISILREDLNCGFCDILKTGRFFADFTRIFNQLSDQSDQVDAECCDSYLRLCLQCGLEVVKCSIDMVINLPGFSPVLASTLRTISFICRSRGEDGLALTTKLLMEKLKENLTPEVRKELTVFLGQLLKIPTEGISPYFEGSVKDLLPLDVSEVFEKLVCPDLNMEDEIDKDILSALEIFNTIVDLYPEVVLESPFLLSSITSLILLHHNCTCLDSSKYSHKLSIRKAVEQIYYPLEKLILSDMDTYREKIILLGIHLSHYELHFRSNFLVSRLLGHAVADDTTQEGKLDLVETCTSEFVVDKLFYCNLMKTCYDDEREVPKCTRTEWIWALYTILPDSDESEWLCFFDLTHSYLNVNIGDTNLVTPTLKIFQEVLLLLCDSLSRLPKEHGKRISISHCFKCFSNASVKFVNERLKEDEHQFYSLINIFTWWCKAQRVLDCDAQYPAIFLSQLMSALSDLLQAKQVVVAAETTSSTISTCGTPSDGSSLCSSKLESVEDGTSQDQEGNESNKENLRENEESNIKRENEESNIKRENLDSNTKRENEESNTKRENEESNTKRENLDSNTKRENLDSNTKRENLDSNTKRENEESNTKREHEDSNTKREHEESNTKRENEESNTKINKKQTTTKKKTKNVTRFCKVIPRKDFEDALDSLVRALVKFVRPSDVTSTVAGKLKALCEL